jgi:hypothetical protein
MSLFHITSDLTEDTFDSTHALEDAIRIAREVAKHGQAGETVCIEYQGKNIRQFVLIPNGEVVEEVLA